MVLLCAVVNLSGSVRVLNLQGCMSGLLSNRLGVPLFLMRIFHLQKLHMLTRGHRNGLSS